MKNNSENTQSAIQLGIARFFTSYKIKRDRIVVCVRFCHAHTSIQSNTANWQN